MENPFNEQHLQEQQEEEEDEIKKQQHLQQQALLYSISSTQLRKPDPQQASATNEHSSLNSLTALSASSYVPKEGFAWSPVKIQRARLVYDPEPKKTKPKTKKRFSSSSEGEESDSLRTNTMDRERVSRKDQFQMNKKRSNDAKTTNNRQAKNEDFPLKMQGTRPACIRMFKSHTLTQIDRKSSAVVHCESASNPSGRRSQSIPRSQDLKPPAKTIQKTEELTKEKEKEKKVLVETPKKRVHHDPKALEAERKHFEKEEIKKRLEKLKMSTKEILKKSVKNKTARTQLKFTENLNTKSKSVCPKALGSRTQQTSLYPEPTRKLSFLSTKKDEKNLRNSQKLEKDSLKLKEAEEKIQKNLGNCAFFISVDDIVQIEEKPEQLAPENIGDHKSSHKEIEIDKEKEKEKDLQETQEILSKISEKKEKSNPPEIISNFSAKKSSSKDLNIGEPALESKPSLFVSNLKSNPSEHLDSIKEPSRLYSSELLTSSVKAKQKSMTSDKETPPLTENSRRVGLLRKPEIKDHSYSALKDFHVDKENLTREMLTPKLTSSLNTNFNKTVATSSDCKKSSTNVEGLSNFKESKVTFDSNVVEIKSTPYEIENKSDVKTQTFSMLEPKTPQTFQKAQETAAKTLAIKAEDLNLEVPSVRLVSKSTEDKTKDPSDLSYWLKPSAAHVYPYNFIVAVRRKLEAYANSGCNTRKIETKCAETSTRDLLPEREEEKPNPYLNPLYDFEKDLRKPEETKPRNKRPSRKREMNIEKINEWYKNFRPKQSLDSDGQTPSSDLETNCSSNDFLNMKNKMKPQRSHSEGRKTLELSKSQTKTRSKSHGINDKTVTIEEDTTTISSSVLGSPDKRSQRLQDYDFKVPRPLSPLSLEKIEHLKIKPKKFSENVHKDKKGAGGGGAGTGGTFEDKISSKSSSRSLKKSKEPVNVNQLLEEFNQSLSQVIEVNEKLRNTLDKSNIHFSPRQLTAGKSSTPNDYTNDFESSSTKSKTKLSESLGKEKSNSKDEGIKIKSSPNFDLGIKSLSNSSVLQDEDEEEENENEEEMIEEEMEIEVLDEEEEIKDDRISSEQSDQQKSSALACEQQLNAIDEFKAKLKQSIMASQKARFDDEHHSHHRPHHHHHKTKKTLTKPTFEQGCTKASLTFEKHLASIQEVKARLRETIRKAQINNQDYYTSSARLQQDSTSSSSPRKDKTTLPNSDVESKTSSSQKKKNKMKRPSLENDKINESNSNEEIEISTIDSDLPKNDGEEFLESPLEGVTIQTDYDSPQKDEEPNDYTEESIQEKLQSFHMSPSTSNAAEPLQSSYRKESSPDSLKQSFIDTHVMTSRGDFISHRLSHLNEAQFAEAIEEANHCESPQDSAGSISGNNSTLTAPVEYDPPEPEVLPEPPSDSRNSNLNSSNSPPRLGSEIAAIFNHNDLDLSYISSRQSSISDSSINYSYVGMYEKLIKNEISKSDYLLTLLKMREKALLDRTRGQIAWLEVQKERYKSQGLLMHITAIKKKQRSIISKMQKEREEIKRLLQSTKGSSGTESSSLLLKSSTKNHHQRQHHHHHSQHQEREEQLNVSKIPEVLEAPPLLLQKKSFRSSGQNSSLNTSRSAPIVRANYDLEISKPLEDLLLKREADLKRRREHVERLMEWHQKLDQEEAEVYELEQKLFNSNNMHLFINNLNGTTTTTRPGSEQNQHYQTTTFQFGSSSNFSSSPGSERSVRSNKMERRLKDIDKSLQELHNISSITTSNRIEPNGNIVIETSKDYVRTTGNKLNKLWRRLTSQQIEKFEPNRRYKLCKTDLENLYEEAKIAVIQEFTLNEERIAAELLEKSSQNSYISHTNSPPPSSQYNNINTNSKESSRNDEEMPYVPELNLTNSTASQSERGDELSLSKNSNDLQHQAPSQDTYSPSIAEQDFQSSSQSMVFDDEIIQQALQNASKAASKAAAANCLEQQSEEKSARLKRNIDKFLQLTYRLNSEQPSLQRSHSDPQLNELPLNLSLHNHHENRSNLSTNSLNSTLPPKTTYDSIKTRPSPSLPSTSPSKLSSSLNNSKELLPKSQHTTNSSGLKSPSLISSEPNPKPSPPPISPSQTPPSKRPSVICSVGKTANNTSSQSLSPLHSSNSDKEIYDDNLESGSSLLSSLGYERAQSLKELSDASESKAREISEKLSQITAAVYNLEKIQSLPDYEQSKNSIKIKTDPSSPSISASSSSYKESFENSSATSKASKDFSNTHSQTASVETILSPVLSNSSGSLDVAQYSNSKPNKSSTPDFGNQSTTLKTKSFSFDTAPATSSLNLRTTTEGRDSLHNSINFKTSSQVSDLAGTLKNSSTSLPAGEMKSFSKSFSPNCVSSPRKDSSVSLQQIPNSKSLSYPDYEPDFEATSDDIKLEDLSLPKFDSSYDSTTEDSRILDESGERTFSSKQNTSPKSSASNKSSSNASGNLLSFDLNQKNDLLPPPPPPPPAPIATPPTSPNNQANYVSAFVSNVGQNSTLKGPVVIASQQVSEIIKDPDLTKTQPLVIDSEQLKQYEHIKSVPVPYMYVREIPNKPPPPYVPPAHGSPMTTIFPSEERIKDITFRRTHELFCDLTKTDYINEKGEKLPSVLSEKITNIYERIILDICREYLEENGEILKKGDPNNFHNRLAFFNPPNRLHCIQERIYKEVRHCLAMDKKSPNRSQPYSIYGARAKRDHIGKIIIQEMYDEDELWCNFHREENEVIDLILQEIVDHQTAEILKEICEQENIPFIERKANLSDANLSLDNTSNNHYSEDFSQRQQSEMLDETQQNSLNESRFNQNNSNNLLYEVEEISEISNNLGNISESLSVRFQMQCQISAEDS